MAWDVSLFKFSQRYRTLEEIPHDERLSDLGSLKEVQGAVTAVFPETDWTDPHWGIFDSVLGSIEFNVGTDDPVQSLGLHVRAGDAVVDGILLLCEQMDCQAIDVGDGSFLEQSDDPARGLQKWRAYRDQILTQGKTS
ncbi:hypothetical protein [Mitsuaria sp. 7]|uniref:hypothetical protein n=1 Tax=Mitsuaria sp. 7 TaxID=1658665 RepID=UPI0007DDBF54|nr:hypothetical protein [Mitsuaria sp. 7]ANH67022.1 hypothetical protein ABE85_04570 [Mitsuaria sp. 7]